MVKTKSCTHTYYNLKEQHEQQEEVVQFAKRSQTNNRRALTRALAEAMINCTHSGNYYPLGQVCLPTGKASERANER